MKYTPELLKPLVEQSVSFADLARLLGLAPIGSNTTNLSRRCKQYGIDTSHFTSQGHRRGKPSNNKLTPDELFVYSSSDKCRVDAARLRRGLVESGVDYRCAVCNEDPVWMGKPLQLQVDHIDGQYWNNTHENLRFICPNCHTQTDTWGKKKRK